MTEQLWDALLSYAGERYGTKPEHPWRTLPDYTVLRHDDNKKWYGVLMNVPGNRLGLADNSKIPILNVKCDPMLSGMLRSGAGFLPAYHMNHEQWLTILLDGTVALEKITSLLDMSFELTCSAKNRGRCD